MKQSCRCVEWGQGDGSFARRNHAAWWRHTAGRGSQRVDEGEEAGPSQGTKGACCLTWPWLPVVRLLLRPCHCHDGAEDGLRLGLGDAWWMEWMLGAAHIRMQSSLFVRGGYHTTMAGSGSFLRGK
jgi:hypothetical protein